MSHLPVPTPGDHEPIHGPHEVSLRPIAERDLPDIIRWRSDPGVVEFWGPPPANEAAAREDLRPDVNPVWRFVIEVEGRGVGHIQYYHAYADTDYTWSAGIDIYIGEPKARGRGLGTEAMRTLLRYLFEVKRLHRVTIDPEPGNRRAIRSYEKAGFRFDGLLRHHARLGDRYVDAYWMSILDDEWPAARARWEAERGPLPPHADGPPARGA